MTKAPSNTGSKCIHDNSRNIISTEIGMTQPLRIDPNCTRQRFYINVRTHAHTHPLAHHKHTPKQSWWVARYTVSFQSLQKPKKGQNVFGVTW